MGLTTEVRRLVDEKKTSTVRFRYNGINWIASTLFRNTSTFTSIADVDQCWKPASDNQRHNHRRRWSFVVDGIADDGGVHVKYQLPRYRREMLKYALRPTRSSAEWRNSHLLIRLGIPVPEPLAVGDRRQFGLWRQGFFIARSVGDGGTLKTLSETSLKQEDRVRIIEFLAERIATMHRAGVYHRDLHGDNILVERKDGRWQTYLVDLHELWRIRCFVSTLAMDDLARLNGFVSAGKFERLRFAVRYLKKANVPRQQWKRWIRGIDSRTRQLWSRYRKKGFEYARY